MATKRTRPTRRRTRRPTTRPPENQPAPPAIRPLRKDLHHDDTVMREATRPTVVAVGASAGGLEAFSQILERLSPAPNVAIVFVQHLSPSHESALPALLSARTPLPVVQVTDGLDIEANRVHVVPPNVQMEVRDGRLHLLPRSQDRSRFTPIDFFFESVARWAQDRSIGVILSGTASDGAAGVREIKAAGGITLAQSPRSAKYDSMPRAAIATGMVDLVLTPGEIAEHLSGVREHPYLVRSAGGDADGIAATDDQFRELFGILRRASGIDFRQYKTPTVRRRLLRRMALHHLTEVDAYLRYLREHPPEAAALSRDLLIHVTRFFRDPDSFKALEVHALHEVMLEDAADPIRVWVPGCATGEEAYSIAMLIVEILGDRAAERRVQIFGTDVSEAAIEHARLGRYPDTIAADVSPERLKRFFTKVDDHYRVSKIVRDLCIFARHDLTRDPPFSRLDLVVCRNVLIYFDAALQKRLISVFHYALKGRGFLMLGAAETAGPQGDFTVVEKKWRLYRKAPSESAVAFAVPRERLPAVRAGGEAAQRAFRPEGRPVQDEASRVILEKYGPPGVVVDGNYDIVQFRGHTGPFLEAPAGEPNLNVLKMARGGLLHPLRSALSAARRKRRPARKAGVLVQRDGEWSATDLEVLPLGAVSGEHFLILFAPPAPSPPAKGRRTTAPPAARTRGAQGDERVGDLRRELAASRDYLQSIIQELEAANEELQSANEEILSSNEELQSTNEELDTAKEELQSTNEELNTLNEELHSRNEELARVNSDLVNLLASVDQPVVIVDDSLAIRRFTPAAERLFNLIPADAGRPISQINPNIDCENFETLIRTTIDSVEPHEQEVRDRAGRWHVLRVRPYKGFDNRLDGAVITAVDIDDARRYQHQTERGRDYLMSVVDTVSQPALVLDDALRVQTANEAFEHVFGIPRQQVRSASILEMADGRWNVPGLRSALAAAASGEAAHQLPIELPGGRDGSRRLSLNARGFELYDGRPWILLIMESDDEQQGR